MRSSAGRPQSGPRLALLAGLVAGAALLASLAHAGGAGTDAFTLNAPGSAWKRAAAMDPPGRLSWATSDPQATSGQLRVSFEGVIALDPRAAVAELLEREKNIIRFRSDRVDGVERGEFAADSLVSGNLRWYGFRVDIKTGDRVGTISRWVALHPDFPRRRRAFSLALDEETLPGARQVSRLPDAMASLRTLVPRGAGLGGGLAEAYLDARAATFAARIDSTTKLCWSSRGADASPARAWVGIGKGLALEGDFHEFTDRIPRDSLVDAGAVDYGTVFDRNGDGKIDLVVLNRGLCAARGSIVLPITAVLADDDFDGRIDGSVFENGDTDGDGRLDHRLIVLDTDHDGRPDRAVSFTDAIADKANKSVPVKLGVVSDRIVGNTVRLLDFSDPWREANARMPQVDQARSACPR
jgi:hypothetical protein